MTNNQKIKENECEFCGFKIRKYKSGLIAYRHRFDCIMYGTQKEVKSLKSQLSKAYKTIDIRDLQAEKDSAKILTLLEQLDQKEKKIFKLQALLVEQNSIPLSRVEETRKLRQTIEILIAAIFFTILLWLIWYVIHNNVVNNIVARCVR